MIYRFADCELDSELYELRRDGVPSKVEPRVFDLLHFLVRNAGRVVSRDEIVEEIWDGRIVSEATISTCVKAARQAVGDDGRAQRFIKTVHGRGFRFVGAVSAEDASKLPSGQTADITPAVVVSEDRSTSGVPPTAPITSGRPTLAVLPFDNLSAEVDEYFADGLTEDIITNLSRFRELQVIARTASFQFKGRSVGLAQIAGEFGANYVVEGSVRRAGGRVRITAQLIDAASGVHLWADRYDREMEDIFALQDEVTRTIAATLGVKLQDVALTRSLKKSPAELDAYDCVLHARRYTSLLSTDMHAEARDLLEKAVALDQSSAEAHALLANVYLAEHRFDANPRPDPIGRALKMAQTATRLDPQDAYAHCWLAIVHFFRGENDKFEVEAQRALALNPNDPETLADIGHYLAFMGEFERGIELSRRAQQLNPLHPGWYYFSFARYHYDQREYDKVLADIERISLPDFYWSWLLRAAALGQLGREEAGASLAQVFALKPDFSARTELQKWNAAAKDMEHILQGLRKAGLDE
ncbi:MAG: winged helix-turn-helix domain-containing tetratricopeptide repeat protein [Alphaproteobacteria bacterium]|nr:winged helix-turn-helix domain-containing tetratricopeptide repeat protein [Alphaproteobacteria bacterium]